MDVDMAPLIAPPLFAAQDYVGLIFVILALAGWIYNLVSGQNPARPPVVQKPRQPPRPRDDRLQDEIDIFIKEVSPGRSQPSPQRPPASRKPPAPKRPPAPADASAGRNKPRTPAKPLVAQATPPAQKRPSPGSEIANRSAPGSRDLGNAIRQQVAGQLPPRKIEREVAEDLKDRIAPVVTEHLGKFIASPPPGPTAGSQTSLVEAARIAELMKHPETIKQAILINAILSPPRSLALARAQRAK